MNYFFVTIVAILAVWRVTRMIQNENLPFNIGGRFRKALRIKEYEPVSGYAQTTPRKDAIKPGGFRDLMGCFKCLSFWVAVPFANHIINGFWLVLGLALAINAGAILLEHYAERHGM